MPEHHEAFPVDVGAHRVQVLLSRGNSRLEWEIGVDSPEFAVVVPVQRIQCFELRDAAADRGAEALAPVRSSAGEVFAVPRRGVWFAVDEPGPGRAREHELRSVRCG